MQRPEDIIFSIYWGCVIPNRYPSVEKATRTVLANLAIKSYEMQDVTCCPAPGVFKSVDRVLWLTLAARNIAIAEKSHTDIVTFCSLCYSTLIEVEQKLRSEPELKNKINEILKTVGFSYQGTSRIRHFMDVLYYDIGIDKIRSVVKKKTWITGGRSLWMRVVKTLKSTSIWRRMRTSFIFR